MGKKAVSRSELLERWKVIEEEDDGENHNDGNDHASKRRRRLRLLKEAWFSDAFNYLIDLPPENHIWCGFRDVMGPLLETFYNYSEDEPRDSPLKILWTRISCEMRHCTQCICQHHQTQQTYATDYEPSSIGPLLQILRTLDEERICINLKEINAKVSRGEYDPACENANVVCIMFEVLMFPLFLDDQGLSSEFETFIEAIDNSHELTLMGNQQYPGVYALLFFKSRRARSIGYRLAGHMGKLRKSSDLDPLQPLLKKCIGLLETEVMPSATETTRPRVQLERMTVWLGIKSILGFLEPPAFEDGILDRYPVFLSIVLNHVSDDSHEFSYAAQCLRLTFEMLGCKLWLRSTLSPSVMRNTLLGQCFHTRNEKIHKEIFDLFQPFLQSLESLQDGEHELQRRHFLFFLLHQVTVSGNFSTLMRKKACQIALLIVYRGYKMNPPCPPHECAHMWGPSLISTLKDSSLHISLRQPAFDLIQSIIVSDASALVGAVLNYRFLSHNETVMHTLCIDKTTDDEAFCFGDAIVEEDKSCWNEFYLQSKITFLVYEEWSCIPMLWFDVLVGIDPLILPISFTKAVFWALSRFSMVESQNSFKSVYSVEDFLATCGSEMSRIFGWKVPSGSDDGGDGSKCKNSINISKLHVPLIRLFRRLASRYILRMEQVDLRKQWAWEPMMADSLILLLVDPNDNDRKVSRHILEQFSGDKGLTSGLQFLCSSQSSLEAVFLGLRHALRLVLLDTVLQNFETLHHLFFVLCKIIKEGSLSSQSIDGNAVCTFSSQGGFLRQPDFDPKVQVLRASVISSNIWEDFRFFISELAWASVEKCLAKGKEFKDNKISQMTLIRLLEIVPVMFEKLGENSDFTRKLAIEMKWLQDLIDWGRSSLAVVARYWKQTLAALLGLLKKPCCDIYVSAIRTIEGFISSDVAAVDEINDQVARISVSLKNEGYFTLDESNWKSKALFSDDKLLGRNSSVENVEPFPLKGSEVNLADSDKTVRKDKGNIIILLDDDDEEPAISAAENIQSHHPNCGRNILHSDKANDVVAYSSRNSSEIPCGGSSNEFSDPIIQKLESDKIKARKQSPTKPKLNPVVKKENEYSECSKDGSFPWQNTFDLNLSVETSVSGRIGGSISQHVCEPKVSSNGHANFRIKDDEGVSKVRESTSVVLKEVVRDNEDDSWEFTFFKSARSQKSLFAKPSHPAAKRQVIQLHVPMENKSWRVNSNIRRFGVPRLDDWYKPILELDYFITVGLVPADKDENKMVSKLKEVPVSFKSPDDYVEVFQPLVLEEFRAQLHSSFQEMTSVELMNYGGLSVLSVERIDDFHIVRCAHDDSDPIGSRSFFENDLILLTRQPFSCSYHDVHMVGKVERREADTKRKLSILVIRLYLQNGSSRLNRARKYLVERSKWYISRLMSITPQLREFQALSSLREIPLLPVILDPSTYPHRFSNVKNENLDNMPQSLQQVMKASYNTSQLQAISGATGSFGLGKDFGFSLIQGPPGTGKTRTILAIVSCLLALSQMRKKKDTSASKDPYCMTISGTRSRSQIDESAVAARAWQDAALAKQLHEAESRNTKFTGGGGGRGRVLICAQSNAAVDELVSRILTEGLYGCDGLMYKPYLVRVGNLKTVHPNSLPFFIDTLVDRRLAKERVKDGKNETSVDSVSILRSNLESLVDRIRFCEARRANIKDGDLEIRSIFGGNADGDDMKELNDAEIEAILKKLYEKKKMLYKDLSDAQAQDKKVREESKALKHKLRRAILKEAEIVITTLSGCGGDLYGVCAESMTSHKFSSSSESTLFDAVVVDEAAQALETATLIPLQLLKSKGTRCIMVGDPKQLPATVISNIASKYLFQCSMFERLQRAGHPIFMLTQQYRMHPEICRFPASHFYDGKLKNGDLMTSKAAAFHETEGLGPYLFFDVADGQESHGKNSGSLSLHNECEADAAVEVIRFFRKRYPMEFAAGRIGVITPYKSQLSVLRSRFSTAFGSSISSEIEFNTVDGFQGREVDILVLSTVRAAELCSQSNSSSIGFVADARRMNVALTRAKFSLWILGNARTLQTNENWASLLRDAKERNLVRVVKKPYHIFKSASDKVPVFEVPVNDLRHPQLVERVKAARKYANLQTKNANDKLEEKKNCIPSEEQIDTETVENVAINGTKPRKRRFTGERDVEPTNDVPSMVVANFGGQKSGGLKSPASSRQISNRGTSHRRTSEMRNKGSVLGVGDEKINGYSGMDSMHLEKVKGGNCNHLDFVESQRRVELSKYQKRQSSVTNTCVTSSGGPNVKGGMDVDKTSGPTESVKDTIMRRKHQRDAVEALLSSALISSKKHEPKVKSLPVRTSSSASVDGDAIRPTKQRKGHMIGRGRN